MKEKYFTVPGGANVAVVDNKCIGQGGVGGTTGVKMIAITPGQKIYVTIVGSGGGGQAFGSCLTTAKGGVGAYSGDF